MLALGLWGSADSVVRAAIGGSVTLIAVGLSVLTTRQAQLVAAFSEAAGTDALTGLPNRRSFQLRMEQELARARREDRPLALVVADLDDFKAVNDRLGHLGGDMALERAAGAIARSTRQSDTAARVGGEEFGIILPGEAPLEALSLAERIRARVEDSFEGTSISLTISLGIASFPDDGGSVEQLLGAADKAMYAAKALGKNRSVIHSSRLEMPFEGDATDRQLSEAL